MSTDVYIGSVDEIEWDALPGTEKWGGNVAHRAGPFFPPAFGRRSAWDELIDMIQAHELDGKQVDWAAYAARVTKRQIVAFMDRIYGPNCEEWYEKAASPSFSGFSQFVSDMRSLQELVARMTDHETRALMAVET